MDDLLLALVRKGAHLHPVRITTSELGQMLGMSQQNASRRISSLEKGGLIARTKDGISLTDAGAAEMREIYSGLREAFEKKATEFSGVIVSGFGEGKYYLSFEEYKSQIKEKFGFSPYAGTLNVRLSPAQLAAKSAFLRNAEPVMINGFKKEGRNFGDLFAYSCLVDGTEAALIVPARTHHPPEIIELVAPANLKSALKKKDGESVKIALR